MNAPREWRDLQWLLCAPPLLSNTELLTQDIRRLEPDLAQNVEVRAWLDALRTAPQPLLDFIAQHRSAVKHLRLGRYAERLLEFYLRFGPAHRLAAANIALRHAPGTAANDHTTLGEIDFLLHDAQGLPWHWELAVKYFLCHASGPVARPEDFIGPDAAETLRSKLLKLERQLSHTPPAPWDATPWQRAAFSRGWMFYRWGRAVPYCKELHPQHLKGWWLPLSELPTLPHARYALVGRAAWMSVFDPAQDTALVLGAAEQLRAQLDEIWAAPTPPGYKAAGAQMVVGLDEAQGGGLVETARYFFMPQLLSS